MAEPSLRAHHIRAGLKARAQLADLALGADHPGTGIHLADARNTQRAGGTQNTRTHPDTCPILAGGPRITHHAQARIGLALTIATDSAGGAAVHKAVPRHANTSGTDLPLWAAVAAAGGLNTVAQEAHPAAITPNPAAGVAGAEAVDAQLLAAALAPDAGRSAATEAALGSALAGAALIHHTITVVVHPVARFRGGNHP